MHYANPLHKGKKKYPQITFKKNFNIVNMDYVETKEAESISRLLLCSGMTYSKS